MAEKNEIITTFSDLMLEKLDSASDALPKGLNKLRFVNNAMSVLNSNPSLTQANKAQLIQGLMKGAYLGLDASNSEFYLIPYGNTVQFQTSYRGEIKFVKRYSIRPIKDIYAQVVREGDDFSVEIKEGKPSIYFKPIPFNKKEIVGCFAVVLYEDGCMDYEMMSTEEINNTRTTYSKAANSKAWKNSWDEMSKKTVLRRLCKHIETDFESIEARQSWEDGSDADFTVRKEKSDEVIDVFADNQPKDVFVESEVVEVVEEG